MNINIRKQELEQKIAELETSLAELKANLQAIEQKQQHEAIENLEDYLDMIDDKYYALKQFWKIIQVELRQLISRKKNTME